MGGQKNLAESRRNKRKALGLNTWTEARVAAANKHSWNVLWRPYVPQGTGRIGKRHVFAWLNFSVFCSQAVKNICKIKVDTMGE